MNIFVVESPFQLLSAIEANYHFKEDANILIIRYAPENLNPINNEQLRSLKNNIEWTEIVEVKDSKSYFKANIKLLNILKKLHDSLDVVDNVFIGEYRSWYMRQFFNVLNPNKCFLLDDGSATIAMQKKYIPSGTYYNEKSMKSLVKNILNYSYLFFLTKQMPKKRIDINLFTCFELSPHNKVQHIVKHNFGYIKKRNTFKIILEKTVYFFGSDLSEIGLMKELDLIEELQKVKLFFDAKNIEVVYIPHRRESEEKIEKIKNEFNFTIRYNQYPAEIEFTLIEEIPEYLASFYSTALYTVSSMIDFKEVMAFELPYEKISPKYREDTREVYKNYKKTMKVINLNDSK